MARKVSPRCVLPVKSSMRRLDLLRAAVNFVMTHGSALKSIPSQERQCGSECRIGVARIYLELVLRCVVLVILCWFGQRAGGQEIMAYILEGQFLQMWGLGDIITDKV